MSSPYINTKLKTRISLLPDQLDNKIYINLKRNLERNILNKCFRSYGFVSEIYEIIKYESGLVEPENLMASAIFNIEFSCRLCRPIKNTKIICQINRVNKVLITAENGPILVIITNDRINDKVFFTDNNNNIRYKKDDTSHILKSNDFVIITILSIMFNNGDDKIKAIGMLDNIASEKDTEKFYSDLYNKDGDTVVENISQFVENN